MLYAGLVEALHHGGRGNSSGSILAHADLEFFVGLGAVDCVHYELAGGGQGVGRGGRG